MSCENGYGSNLLNEAAKLGLVVPGYPHSFDDPMEVERWSITVRRKITLFLAGKIDQNGNLIED